MRRNENILQTLHVVKVCRYHLITQYLNGIKKKVKMLYNFLITLETFETLYEDFEVSLDKVQFCWQHIYK